MISQTLITVVLMLGNVPEVRYAAEVGSLRHAQPQPGLIGKTETDLRDQWGTPWRQSPRVWTELHLGPGAHSFAPATVVLFRDGKVVSAAQGIRGVGCIIVERRDR